MSSLSSRLYAADFGKFSGPIVAINFPESIPLSQLIVHIDGGLARQCMMTSCRCPSSCQVSLSVLCPCPCPCSMSLSKSVFVSMSRVNICVHVRVHVRDRGRVRVHVHVLAHVHVQYGQIHGAWTSTCSIDLDIGHLTAGGFIKSCLMTSRSRKYCGRLTLTFCETESLKDLV
jgi:hypothetical protein